MRFYLGCVAFMIVPFLSSCASGNGVSVVDMGGRKAEYSLSASGSLPGIAGNPADIMVFDSLLLVLDEELTTFAVDEKNGIIYGVTNSDGIREPELVSFAIPHD